MIRAVLFDVGGVLTRPLHTFVLDAMRDSGVDPQALQSVLMPMFASADDGDEPAHRWERGEIDLEGFLALLGPTGEAVRPVLDPASSHFLAQGVEPHQGMHAFAAEVRAGGLQVGVLSNIMAEWLPTWWRALPQPEAFDAVLFSCEVGHRKPGAAIYRLALERLGVEPAEAVLLDDFVPMVAGARAVGMHAVEVRDHDAAIAETRTLLASLAA